MTEWRLSIAVGWIFCFLMSAPVAGQLKETCEPAGYLLEWGSQGSSDGLFDGPARVAVDTLGNVYVSDPGNHRIQKFDSSGNYLLKWGSQGSGDGQFETPFGVAADGSGNIFVADSGNHRIQRFDSAGNFLSLFGGLGSGDGQFQLPYGVAADAAGNVYVADSDNRRIQKFDSAGNFLTQWGSVGSAQGEFDSPWDIAVDASGNVYVADLNNYRVQKFDNAGKFLTQWGNNGAGDSEFNKPFALATDVLGNVYVADHNNHRIQKFDGAGDFLSKWGTLGTGDSQFWTPRGVAVDGSGNVYVADRYNHRIQKFAPVWWFELAGYDALLSVSASHETTTVRTLLQLENNGVPRFAFTNTTSDIEWSFQQSAPGNFLISREGTGGPEMQVYQNGRVRMGPSGAANFDLAPNGNLAIAGGLTANGGTFPDYVFESSYPLLQLEDLRAFVLRENRLPNIPSAGEVRQRGGQNMTELQLKLLEKVEELTLYILQQEQRLQKKDSEIRQLEADLSLIEKVLDSERRVQ